MFQVQDPRQAMIQRFVTAQVNGGRVPFIRAGHHVLGVSEFKMEPSQSDGPMVVLRGVVLQTNNPSEHPIGSQVERQFKINQGAKYQGDKGDRIWGELMQCVSAMFAMPMNTDADRQAVGSRWFDLMAWAEQNPDANALRGLVITCTAEYRPPRQKKNEAPGVMTKGFTGMVFGHVPNQNDQTVAQMRAQIEHYLANPPAPPAPSAGAAPSWMPGAQAAPQAAQVQAAPPNPFAAQTAQVPTGWPGAGAPAAPAVNPFGAPAAQPAPPVSPAAAPAPGPFTFGAPAAPAAPTAPAPSFGAAPGGPPRLF